jgi:hypothetical protein
MFVVMRPWRPLGREGKSITMILNLKEKFLLQILLKESCVPVIVPARNPLGAAHRRSQESSLHLAKSTRTSAISCKSNKEGHFS